MEGNDIIGKEVEGYKILKYLGQGKFSVVYKAERLKDQKQVAMKIVKIFDMMDNKQREKCLQEVNLLKSLDHPGIVKYLDSFLLNNELYIAIEWANKGDLKGYIRSCAMQSEKIECEKIVDYVKQLAEALHHMHEKRIIHRDLKPANILIFGDGTLKLSDLGLGRYMSNETIKAFSRVGTPLYMSPEIIRDAGYDFKCDIWSIGCVIYELMTFKSPFRMDEKFTLIDLFNKINNGQYHKITDEFYPLELRNLVDKMLRVNPEERISVEEVLKICNQLLVTIEEARPKFDPILIMEDIIEQLNLINYDVHFCKKFKRPKINRTYFAIPLSGNIYTTNNPTFESVTQFTTFVEISQWLIHLIKEKIKYTELQNPSFINNFKLKEIDKKRKPELYVKEILDVVKSYNFNDKNLNFQVSRININAVVCGWGESICLLLRLLLNMYLLNEQFCFYNPNFDDLSRIDSTDNFLEVELIEENVKPDQLLEKKAKNCNINIIPNGEINEDEYLIRNNKKSAKEGKNSAVSHKSDLNSALSTQTDQFKFDPNHCIIEPSVDPNEWRKECDKVCNLLVIQENVEFIYNSQSEENLKSYMNFDDLNTDNFMRGKSFSAFCQFFNKVSGSVELNNMLSFAGFIENEISVLDRFENRLTTSLHQKLGGIKTNTSSRTVLEKNIEIMSSKLKSMEETLQSLEEIIENKSNEYEILKKKDYSLEYNKMKKSIFDIQIEIKNLDLKIAIINNSLLNKFILDHSKKEKRNQFGFEDLIDEYL